MEALKLIWTTVRLFFKPPTQYFLILFIFFIIILAIMDIIHPFNFWDLQPHFHSIVIEIFFLSFLFSFYEITRKKNSFIEEIQVLKKFKDDFAQYRKCMIIKELNEMNVTEIDLNEIYLKGVRLKGINLSGSILYKAQFIAVDLTGCNLNEAKIFNIRFDNDTILENVTLAIKKSSQEKFELSNFLEKNQVDGRNEIMEKYILTEEKKNKRIHYILQKKK
jgi:Pentapeptide repeats (8 copies)